MSYASDALIDALGRDVDRLERENGQLEYENAKLREVCAELLKMAERHDPEWLHWPEMYEELRKLGVKVVKL